MEGQRLGCPAAQVYRAAAVDALTLKGTRVSAIEEPSPGKPRLFLRQPVRHEIRHAARSRRIQIREHGDHISRPRTDS